MQAHHGTSVSACLLLWLSLHLSRGTTAPIDILFLAPSLCVYAVCRMLCFICSQHGAGAQEENLCRRTGYSMALDAPSGFLLQATAAAGLPAPAQVHMCCDAQSTLSLSLSLSLSRYVALRQLIDWSPLCYIAYHVGGQKQYRFDVPDWGV